MQPTAMLIRHGRQGLTVPKVKRHATKHLDRLNLLILLPMRLLKIAASSTR
jgi:hypothetical protein